MMLPAHSNEERTRCYVLMVAEYSLIMTSRDLFFTVSLQAFRDRQSRIAAAGPIRSLSQLHCESFFSL